MFVSRSGFALRRVSRRAVWILVASLGSVAAQAETHTWTGTNGPLWSDDANWIEGSPSGDPRPDLVFPGDAASLESTDDLPGVTPINSIRFTGGGYTLSAQEDSQISLLDQIVVVSSGGSNTIALPVTLAQGGSGHRVVLAAVGTQLEFAGPVHTLGSTLTVNDDLLAGGGRVVFSGTVTAEVAVRRGTVVVSGVADASFSVGRTQPGTYALLLVSGQTGGISVISGDVGGTGTSGGISLNGGTNQFAVPAVLRPGGEFEPGVLSAAGNVRMNVAITRQVFRVRLNGTNPGDYDQLAVSGSVDIQPPFFQHGPVVLEVTLGFVPAIGDCFTIISSGGALTGSFDVGPDGSQFTVQGLTFQINYTPNSVVLTRVA